MPVRFTSPSLGGQRNSFIGAGEWQVGVAYRRLTADEWYVGTQVNEARAPFGQPLYLNINSLDFSVSYGRSDRLSLTLTLPLSYGTHARFYADTARHKVSAHGLGDVNLVGNLWLLDPKVHVAGNVALGLGLPDQPARVDGSRIADTGDARCPSRRSRRLFGARRHRLCLGARAGDFAESRGADRRDPARRPNWRQGQQFSAAGLFAVSRSRHRPAAGRRGVHVELAGPGASGFPTELDRPATELHGWRRPGRIPHLPRLHSSLLISRRARHSSAFGASRSFLVTPTGARA